MSNDDEKDYIVRTSGEGMVTELPNGRIGMDIPGIPFEYEIRHFLGKRVRFVFEVIEDDVVPD